MPVKKYHSLEAMRDDLTRHPAETRLADRIDALWRRAWALAPRKYPRGVFKFRSIEEAQAHREKVTKENVDRLRRERRSQKPAPLQITPAGEGGDSTFVKAETSSS